MKSAYMYKKSRNAAILLNHGTLETFIIYNFTCEIWLRIIKWVSFTSIRCIYVDIIFFVVGKDSCCNNLIQSQNKIERNVAEVVNGEDKSV